MEHNELTGIAVAVFDKNAALYQEKFMDVSLYHESFDRFCSLVPEKGARILDVACGPGNVTRYLMSQRPDFNMLGIDLSEKMLALAGENNPDAEFRLMDCKAIATLDEQFDGIMCGFFLPYLSKDEAIQFIHEASAMLKPHGVLYISTMEDDNRKSDWRTSSTGDRLFMNFHEADYLITALQDAKLKLISEERKTHPGSDGTLVIDLLLLAQRW